MKIIVTHSSPDWDAITSVWLIKRLLPGWHEAEVQFVSAGERLGGSRDTANLTSPIESHGKDEVIHVDTGMGALDHHQTNNEKVSAASLTWEFIQQNNQLFFPQSLIDNLKEAHRQQAIQRLAQVVVSIDHFQEVFWEDAASDYHELSFVGLLDGLKLLKPEMDDYYVTFGMECLDAWLRTFENRLWAEQEIQHAGIPFQTRFGKGMGFETINDAVLDVAQKMGYVIVIRKDPRKGYVRIKARPKRSESSHRKSERNDVDLTKVYEKLKASDPQATWFLHVSKKMLLNGSTKNPAMRPTKLSLREIIQVIESI